MTCKEKHDSRRLLIKRIIAYESKILKLRGVTFRAKERILKKERLLIAQMSVEALVFQLGQKQEGLDFLTCDRDFWEKINAEMSSA